MTDTDFERWEKDVDKIVKSIVGLGTNDGSDWPSRDLFDEGSTPEEGALGWAESQDLLPEELLAAFMDRAGA